MKKVRTDSNAADLLTKPLNGDKIGICMQMMGYSLDSSRASTARTMSSFSSGSMLQVE